MPQDMVLLIDPHIMILRCIGHGWPFEKSVLVANYSASNSCNSSFGSRQAISQLRRTRAATTWFAPRWLRYTRNNKTWSVSKEGRKSNRKVVWDHPLDLFMHSALCFGCLICPQIDTNCIYRDFGWVEQQWALRSLASLSMDGVFCNLSVFGWFSLGLLSGVALHNLRGDAFLGFEI